MKRILIALALACAVSGCAGLDVEWEFHATYKTEELIAKRKAAAQEALDRARDARHAEQTLRAMQP